MLIRTLMIAETSISRITSSRPGGHGNPWGPSCCRPGFEFLGLAMNIFEVFFDKTLRVTAPMSAQPFTKLLLKKVDEAAFRHVNTAPFCMFGCSSTSTHTFLGGRVNSRQDALSCPVICRPLRWIGSCWVENRGWQRVGTRPQAFVERQCDALERWGKWRILLWFFGRIWSADAWSSAREV